MFFGRMLKKLFDVKPFNSGYLPEKDGHKVYFAEVGNPEGKPVICFHGGPGYYSRPNSAKAFDLKKYRVIMFDQRGCGKSMPFGEIKNNSASKTIEDAKRLLDFLNIKKKVVVMGGSWGSTLALLFAEEFPKIIDKLIVTKIFLANKRDNDWQLETSGLFYPDILEEIKKEAEGHKDIAKYYASLINSDEVLKQVKAAKLFGNYENVMGSLNPSLEIQDLDADRLASMRIFINYCAQKMTLKNNEIMEKIDNIKDIKTLIVHNRLDMVCPLQNAYDLHKALPKSKLIISPHMGHSGKELSNIIREEIRRFLD